MLIAEELDVAWSQIQVEQLPYGLMASPAPPGIASKYGPRARAAAPAFPTASSRCGRRARRRAGCSSPLPRKNGTPTRASSRRATARVLHPDGRSLTYAELAPAASRSSTRPTIPCPSRSRRNFASSVSRSRVADARDIVTGRAPYGIDARLPNALVAMIERCPVLRRQHRALRCDRRAARLRRARHRRDSRAGRGPAGQSRPRRRHCGGCRRHLVGAQGARGAQDRVASGTASRATPPSELAQRAHEAARRPGTRGACRWRLRACARSSAAKVVEAEYTQPFLAHATLEPMNALLDLKADRALLIAPIQSPGGASRMINSLTGIPRLNIEIRLVRCGWRIRPAARERLRGRGGATSRASSKRRCSSSGRAKMTCATTSIGRSACTRSRRRSMRRATSRAGGTGSRQRPRKYRTAGMEEDLGLGRLRRSRRFSRRQRPELLRVNSRRSSSAWRVGWWRAPLPTFVTFPIESFMDEVALASGQDPLALRLKLLGESRELDYRDHGGPKFHTGRLAAVLAACGERIGWGRYAAQGIRTRHCGPLRVRRLHGACDGSRAVTVG